MSGHPGLVALRRNVPNQQARRELVAELVNSEGINPDYRLGLLADFDMYDDIAQSVLEFIDSI